MEEVPVKEGARDGERIAKRIARAGVCSRRDAEKLIAERRVSVDGKMIDTPATIVTATRKGARRSSRRCRRACRG